MAAQQTGRRTLFTTPGHSSPDATQERRDIPRPLSGPGATRQSKRLQLRNAGFRAAAVPARKVTPKSMTSASWASISGTYDPPDTENLSPVGTRVSSAVERRRSSGTILQEISNPGTHRRQDTTRPGLETAISIFTDEGSIESFKGSSGVDGLNSPKVQTSSLQNRTLKTRSRRSTNKRRSTSGEASKYIEHLETELSCAQQQLSAILSPSVTREQSTKMRTLNAESRHLQEELDEWERKYDDRVQEEVERRATTESGLRARIRTLETAVEETALKLKELEYNVESTTQTLDAVETANINLEKRLEIMSELLATSPTKIDLHADAAGRGYKRHTRPKSLLPRFPTAGSLMSPERLPRTQPASPVLTYSQASHHGLPISQRQPILGLDTSIMSSDYSTDAESVFSDAPITGESMTTACHSAGLPYEFPHFDLPFPRSSLPPPPPPPSAGRCRPMRRMRRFGAGSLGPKPLLLPHTSHCGAVPASAPPFERHDTPPAYPFPCQDQADSDDSPVYGRRRASTCADEATLARLEGTPFLGLAPPSTAADDSVHSVLCPDSNVSQATTGNCSSFGSAVGRNLLDELNRARSSETVTSTDVSAQTRAAHVEEIGTRPSRPRCSGEDAYPLPPAQQTSPRPSPAETTAADSSPSTTSLVSRLIRRTLPLLDRFLSLLARSWRHRTASAQHLVRSAQTRPRPPHSFQYWLIGMLLGPMARQRLLARSMHPACDAQTHALLLGAGEPQLACQSPPPPPESPARRKPLGATTRHHHHRHHPKHSARLWLKFSLTLAFAVGAAFTHGPGSLLLGSAAAGGCGEVDCALCGTSARSPLAAMV